MAEDFDEYMDEEFDAEEWEPSPEELAEIRIAEQEANMGLVYLMVEVDGEPALKCNKCARTATFHERPFPHRYDCPMKR